MKYVKTYDAVRWYYKGKFEKDDPEPVDDTLEIGDMVIIKNNLYDIYPNWALWFKPHIDNKTPLKVHKFMEDIPEGKCIEFIQGYYIPIDMVTKYHVDEAIRWYYKGKLNEPEPEEKKYNDKPAYQIVSFKDQTLYIVQKYIDDYNMIIFNNNHYSVIRRNNKISDMFFPISEEDREMVLDNKLEIHIYNDEKFDWYSMYYDDLIEKYPNLEGNI